MPASPVHHTAIDKTGAWDGPAAEKAFDKVAADFVKFYAWVDKGASDSDATGTDKEDGWGPHHDVDAKGVPGAANMKGVEAAMAALNGAHGTTSRIPDGDRQGVWDHLAAHYKDAGTDPKDIPVLARSRVVGGETRDGVMPTKSFPTYAPIPYRVDADEAVTCPNCGLKNDNDARYCDQCGTELEGRTDVQPEVPNPAVIPDSEGGNADGSETVPLTPQTYTPAPYNPEADETVQCPTCQKLNDPDAKYCDQDGTYLVGRTDVKVNGPVEEIDNVNRSVTRAIPDDQMASCSVCESDNDPDASYCDQCGTPMAADPESAEGTSSDPDAAEENINDDSSRSRLWAKAKKRAPRESLIRHVEFRAEPDDDGLTLEGYAAVFNEPAMIDSWEGTFRERMMPGAFAKTLSERSPVMMFDHGKHPLIGQLPIASIQTLREDSKGLYVKARLADNWLVEPVRDAIRSQAISGMSMRMSVVKDTWAVGSDRIAERSLKEVALMELGPVVFPAYESTSVSVRSRELFTALSDSEVRAELARIFASGTDLRSAAEAQDEPARHSPRTRSQRQAARLRALSLKGTI